MAHSPTDAVKAAVQKAATTGVTRVVTALVDPVGTAKKAVEDVRELPKVALRLPLRAALTALEIGGRLRAKMPAKGGRGDSAAVYDGSYDASPDAGPTGTPARPPLREVPPLPAAGPTARATVPTAPTRTAPKPTAPRPVPASAPRPAAATSPAAPVAKVAKPPVAPVAKPPAAPAPKSPAPKAPTAKPAAPSAPRATSAAPAAPATPPAPAPLHEGRDGHRELDLGDAVQAAVEAAPDGASLGSGDLPVAGYDGLSLPALRSRLSKLTPVELAQLRDYERAHADRLPVVTMLENRLAKVTAAPGA